MHNTHAKSGLFGKQATLNAALLGCVVFALCALSQPAKAANLNAVMKELGAVAGAGMACDATRLDEYEKITGAIVQARATTIQQRDDALKQYARSKKLSLKKQKRFKPMGCAEVRRRFDSQDIFDTRIYADGSVRTPDGVSYKPVLAVIPYNLPAGNTPQALPATTQNAALAPPSQATQPARTATRAPVATPAPKAAAPVVPHSTVKTITAATSRAPATRSRTRKTQTGQRNYQSIMRQTMKQRYGDKAPTYLQKLGAYGY